MVISSRTGLVPSVPRKMTIYKKAEPVSLTAHVTPAPFAYKPYAGIYNPYPYGCSLFCNHPADDNAKEMLRKAKHSFSIDGKPLLLAEEIAAIRAKLEMIDASNRTPRHVFDNVIEHVPDELFRRYTETDSRPLTPAPTLVSAQTRASGSRRCVTPDPIHMSEVREKTLLVLDLRRSHSQDTLSWQASSLIQEPPIIRIESVATRAASPISRARSHTPDALTRKNQSMANSKRPKSDVGKYDVKIHLDVPSRTESMKKNALDEIDEDEASENVVRRRGKKKRRKQRDSSRGPAAAFETVDPETQVETLGPDSHDPSARPSLVPINLKDDVEQAKNEPRSSLDVGSYLDVEILKLLRRELNDEIVDNEFDRKRKKALEEALRAVSAKPRNDQLLKLQRELQLPIVDMEFVLSLPRVFSRSSARFELPMDSRKFDTMSPMDYVKTHVFVTSKRKLLYNVLFNKHLEENEFGDKERLLPGNKIPQVLDEMMGKRLTDDQAKRFRDLMGWTDEEAIDFKTFCGLSALCERLLAPEYCRRLPPRQIDPCHEIEKVDFEALARRLNGRETVDERLRTILYAIKES